MARAAFIMDKLMHRMGLHGKSFIPLIMGFGCNVPAVMSTRMIESRKSRLITMLVLPFMSCSARLPVYLLLAGAFFPIPWQATLILFSLYIIGVLMAVISARLLKTSVFKGGRYSLCYGASSLPPPHGTLSGNPCVDALKAVSTEDGYRHLSRLDHRLVHELLSTSE